MHPTDHRHCQVATAALTLLIAALTAVQTARAERPIPPGPKSTVGPPKPPSDLVRDKPWIGVVFFYWYTWDYDRQLGSWMGGIHNTPMDGYYDSRTYRDNYRSLQLAGEWGVTHHWMDYWSPNWKGEDGQMREKTVMRAAEALRNAGYNIWMSYYQDGENFDMTDFAKNVTEKRDVYQWLRDFSRSPVWPRIRNKPMQLVYARNGAPALSNDNSGFRAYLKRRYDTIAALNKDWNATFASFDDVDLDLGARGPRRAWSARYQHDVWRHKWRELDEAVAKEFNLPGLVASFDVGYEPYRNLGYAEFARTFGGPHSYAGIFEVPHHLDAERFIQANVCKAYGAVFLDHYKNFYHDWDIRVPGIAYLPDPHHFDRFWVGDLMRYAEAILHLSWNEWWEGSNLEPCMEWGKTYCQKNLFYSTIMQLCYDSIRDWSKGARVGLLLNDYANLAGSMHQEEITQTLQTLRRLNADFDLLPDDFVTAARLQDFKVIVAPAAGVGFGINMNDKRIAEILLDWVKADRNRRLIVSADETIERALGITQATATAPTSRPKGPDMNLFVDVGADGDDRFVIAGRTHPEQWADLAPGQFGAGSKHTVRWTPGLDATTILQLPISPNRDHVLRLAGASIWPSKINVGLDGKPIGEIQLKPGHNEYEFPIPATAVGGRTLAQIQLRYTPLRIPTKEDPKQYPNEARRCNLALDWLQIATANVPAKTQKQNYTVPKGRIRFGSELLGRLNRRGLQVPMRLRNPLQAPDARLLSLYEDGTARDLLLEGGHGRIWYVNGLFNDVPEDEYWRAVLSKWAATPPAELVRGKRSAGARLSVGQTDLLLAYNYAPDKPDPIRCRLPARALPLSEAMALSKDGVTYAPIQPKQNGSWLEWSDTLGYYAVYQLAYAPVRVETNPIVVSPGQTTDVPARVVNLTDQLTQAKLTFRSVIPTLTGKPVQVSLWGRASTDVRLPLTVDASADWGRKAAVIEIESDGKKSYLWRDVVVLRPPDLKLARTVTTAHEPVVEVVNTACPFGEAAPAMNAVAVIANRQVPLGQVPAGAALAKPLNAPLPVDITATQPAEQAGLRPYPIALQCTDDRRTLMSETTLWVARPTASAKRFPEAVAAASVFNHHPRPIDNEIVELPLPDDISAAGPYHLRDDNGRTLPAQLIEGGKLVFPATTPARAATTYTLCRGEAGPKTTDLQIVDQRKENGTLSIANSHYRITLDQAAGGTVTSLVSSATKKDYALRAFDADYGQCSQYDPNHPVTNTVDYINEKKTSLSQQKCTWTRLDVGPVRALVELEVSDGSATCRTTYEFFAHAPWFRLNRRLDFTGQTHPQEIVAVDARFQRHALTKSYPNFVGMPNDKSQPHFGWRYGNWVPDYVTLMTPPDFDESLSILLRQKDGIDQIRQGFWPRNRPKPGPCHQARVELIMTRSTFCDVSLVVYLHKQHQVAAARMNEELNDPPLVTLTREPLWRLP
ncbi:MAG: hypothetical protein JXQ73_03595 [Phycisphaerae bacterium]|nr:hypothetical protein [Phycisphaerae bacterium]